MSSYRHPEFPELTQDQFIELEQSIRKAQSKEPLSPEEIQDMRDSLNRFGSKEAAK